MICKNYTVTGEDVNDFMVMESTAYISYSTRLLYHFLFHNGFSKEKLNALHLGFEEENNELVCYQNLMFTEPFLVEMKHCQIGDKINIRSSFFNAKNECCAEVIKEVQWVDHTRGQIITTPQQIRQHFNRKLSA
ncbi:hypothetical protein B4N84_16050 [Flavobacterium sp. IR1]|nr:hypothetical protein B4N84_16050 [Flavobacterium sp. IR1]